MMVKLKIMHSAVPGSGLIQIQNSSAEPPSCCGQVTLANLRELYIIAQNCPTRNIVWPKRLEEIMAVVFITQVEDFATSPQARLIETAGFFCFCFLGDVTEANCRFC